MVTTTMSTFAGLTVGCARCHDHKFDPITQDDYYALQAVFAGIDKAERTFDVDPGLAASDPTGTARDPAPRLAAEGGAGVTLPRQAGRGGRV